MAPVPDRRERAPSAGEARRIKEECPQDVVGYYDSRDGGTIPVLGTSQCSSVSRHSSARRRQSFRPLQADREQRPRHIVSPCASLESDDTGSDPEYGIVASRYTFHGNFEVNDSPYYFCHFLASFEMAIVRVQGDGDLQHGKRGRAAGFRPLPQPGRPCGLHLFRHEARWPPLAQAQALEEDPWETLAPADHSTPAL